MRPKPGGDTSLAHRPNFGGMTRHELPDGSEFFCGELPTELVPDTTLFEVMWSLHPADYHTIKMHGRLVKTPRFQQAYGADYHYTGNTNKALPTPAEIAPFLEWARTVVDGRLNGALLNWYDGTLGHYIGAHRDSTENLISGVPIVTISLGEDRTFRLRPWKGQGRVDFAASNGGVFVLPFATNLRWTHEVPPRKHQIGRRISLTFRGFTQGERHG